MFLSLSRSFRTTTVDSFQTTTVERGDREAKLDLGLIPMAPLFSGNLSGVGEEGEQGIDRRLCILA